MATPSRCADNEDVKEFYLGIAEGQRKSFREGKHYRRRKRWLAVGDARDQAGLVPAFYFY